MQHKETSHEKAATQKSERLYAARKRVEKVKHEESKKSDRNSDTLKSAIQKSAKWKKCTTKRSERNKKKRVQ